MTDRTKRLRVVWISAAVGAAVVAAVTLPGIVVADAAVQPGSDPRLSAQVLGARPVKPRPTVSPTPTPTPTPTVSSSATGPAVCDAPLVYGGLQYCTGYLSWVKSRYYGIGVRVAIAGGVAQVTGSTMVLTDTFRCPPDRWCGAIVYSDSLQVTFPPNVALPTERQIIRIYGTTTAGTTTGGLDPAGFDVLGVAPTATATCDPELAPC
jgi:hypothetical protein